MGIFRRITNYLRKTASTFLLGDFLPQSLAQGRISLTDYDTAVKSYTSWVYRCASLNANSVAQIPLHLYSRKPQTVKSTAKINHIPVSTKTFDSYLQNKSLENYITKGVDIEEIQEHPFLDLMRNVNPQRNEFDLKNETELFLELTGNSYWYLVPSKIRGMSGSFIPAELWVLPSNRVKIIPDKKKYIKGFEFRESGFEPLFFTSDEVIHFRFPNPMNVLYGMGPLQAAANAIDVNYYMQEYTLSLFKNQGRPDYVIKVANKMHPDQRERFMEMWRDTYRGTKRAGKFGVLEGGMDIKELGFAPKDLEFLVGRKITKEEIVSIFGLPLSKVQTEDVNKANAETGEYQYARDTILPRLRLIEQKITEKLLPIYDDNLFCVFQSPVPEDRRLILEELTGYVKEGIITRDEARQSLGRGSIKGLDVVYLPLNLMPVGGSSEKEIQEIAEKIAHKVKEKIYDTSKS